MRNPPKTHKTHPESSTNNPNDSDSVHELLLDPNFPNEDGVELDTFNFSDNSTKPQEEEEPSEEDSPYPEVRAAVRNYDEPSLPCNTVRAWTIGLSLIFLGASMNTLFSLRFPSISLGALIAQIIAWPMGHAWARFMPAKQFTTFGLRWSHHPRDAIPQTLGRYRQQQLKHQPKILLVKHNLREDNIRCVCH